MFRTLMEYKCVHMCVYTHIHTYTHPTTYANGPAIQVRYWNHYLQMRQQDGWMNITYIASTCARSIAPTGIQLEHTSTDEEFQEDKRWLLERIQGDHTGGMCVNISTSSSPISPCNLILILSIRVQETYWLHLGFSWGQGRSSQFFRPRAQPPALLQYH